MLSAPMQTPTELAKQVKAHFDNRDYEALIRVINEALNLDPSGLDAGTPLREIQGKLEDEKLREELEIHVANLKNEAMKQFDREHYSECLGTFRFLCELEPDDRTLRDYLELCQQLIKGVDGNRPSQGAVPASVGQGTPYASVKLPIASEPSTEHTCLQGSTRAALNLQTADCEKRGRQEPEKAERLSLAQHSEKQEPIKAAALGQTPESAAESVTLGLRFGLVAVALLLAAILGIAYLKGRGQSPKNLREDRPAAGSTSAERSQGGPTVSQADARALLLQKAEAAAALDHYVLPSGDNALVYSNQVLALVPADPQARTLKEESFSKAVSQAKKSIGRGRFAEAREIYSSLLALSEQESRFLLMTQEVQNELDKLEFTVYPVVHDHLLGSCKGHLKINAYVISFVPSGDSTDGFTEPLSEVTLFGPSDRLKIEIRAKTYHFESNIQIMTIYGDLKRRVAKEN
jgi:tetratricopeptide (TPR) repeat protein